MDENVKWQQAGLAKIAVKNLKKNGFKAVYFETADEAAAYVAETNRGAATVGFGGSQTVKALGLKDKFRSLGATLFDHGLPELSHDEKMEIMRRELTSDLFISSTNALTLDGSLINVDGHGNRVAAMIFGPKKVVVIAGTNKIVEDEADGFRRLELAASPANMKRLNRKTPCTHDGRCHNCDSAERGCRAYTILRKRPQFTDIEIVIVGETLGY